MDQIDPAVIFLDVSMLGRDGLELIGHLSARKYPGQVVVISGSDPLYIQMSATIAKTRDLRLAGTLAKPFTKQQVLDLLARLAGG